MHSCALIVAISGQLGSGKSTLARGLCEHFNGETSSFGDYVRYLAAAAGRTDDRSTLQEIGHAAVTDDPSSFVSAFLEWAKPSLDKPFFVDGVRHIKIDQELRSWAKGVADSYLLLSIETPDEIRAERRTDGRLDELIKLDSHPVELEAVTELPAAAGVRVTHDSTLTDILQKIEEWRALPPPNQRSSYG